MRVKVFRTLWDGRVICRDGKQAWYAKTHRFVVPLPRGMVWFKHFNRVGWLSV
jgi:hypothetical protein